jgi:methyl-accepting chemotaxis protein
LPLIGKLSQRKQSALVISIGAALLLGAAVVGTASYSVNSRVDSLKAQINATALLSQALRSDMEAASNGTIPSFRQGDFNNRDLREIIASIASQADIPDGLALGLPPFTATPKWDDAIWNAVKGDVLQGTYDVKAPLTFLAEIQEQADKIGLYEPTILSFTDAVVRVRELADRMVIEATADSKNKDVLLPLALHARESVQLVLSNGGNAGSIKNAMASLLDVGIGIEDLGDPDRSGEHVVALKKAADTALLDIGVVLSVNYSQTTPLLQETMASLTDASEKYGKLADALVNSDQPPLVVAGWLITALLASLALLSLTLLAAISARAASISAWHARKEQKETDEAIIQIMTELRPISRGDLVSRLVVTEHVTGSVADRINLMTEATQEAIQDVKSATREAESSMENIFELSEEANETAETATEQAQSSREMSKEGAAAVARAVDRMNEARQMIQEVSKRAKNLGEVAQSIGSVTELIEQMAEKTKVLALNTSLIASEAGEGGAKYRTLAKEIDKMSDDTKKSLTQISASVKSMQGETQQVITTVENVTAEVVNSSQMWEDALQALDRITKASDAIEGLVTNLRTTTNKQAASASEAVKVMGRLSESAQKFRTHKDESILED